MIYYFTIWAIKDDINNRIYASSCDGKEAAWMELYVDTKVRQTLSDPELQAMNEYAKDRKAAQEWLKGQGLSIIPAKLKVEEDK